MMRHQFQELDGLRGIAAIAVMIFHRRYWLGGDDVLGHAYLAVDFFFMLSGFVIEHAYGARLRDGGGVMPFLRDRAFRLYPMLLLGALLGTAVLWHRVRTGAVALPEYPIMTTIAGFVPFPAFWATGEDAFPINLPVWSLFWELVVNVIFGVVALFLTNRVVAGIIAIAGLAMVLISLGQPGFQVGMFNGVVALGFPRVVASFFIGIALYRGYTSGWRVSLPGGQIIVPAVLLVSFAVLSHTDARSAYYDPIAVFLIYPVLILWAAGANPLLPRASQIAGAISYPLYILHFPLLTLMDAVFRMAFGFPEGHPGPARAALYFMLTIMASFILLRLYDEPVRTWLRRRYGSRAHHSPA